MMPVNLSRDVLNWAAEKAGETLLSFANGVARKDSVRAQIIDGRLTIPQAEKLAKKARIPFGYLFLSRPPKIQRPEIPDFRQVQNHLPLSDEFYEVLEDIVAKQKWYIEYLNEMGAGELSFVGRFSNVEMLNPKVISDDICSTLGISCLDRKSSQNSDAYFSKISEKIEHFGILVFKNSIVKSNTRRPLSEKEFRGFAIANRTAPVIFVNGKDAGVATVFTLLHELAHIWIGLDGVSDFAIKNTNNFEKICNQVAANILVPNNEFIVQWEKGPDIAALAKYFRVSKLVIARRALDSALISQDEYQNIADIKYRAKPKGKPSALLTIPVRNSKRFTKTVVSNAMSGRLLLRDAASLLNVKPDTVISLGMERKKNG